MKNKIIKVKLTKIPSGYHVSQITNAVHVKACSFDFKINKDYYVGDIIENAEHAEMIANSPAYEVTVNSQPD